MEYAGDSSLYSGIYALWDCRIEAANGVIRALPENGGFAADCLAEVAVTSETVSAANSR